MRTKTLLIAAAALAAAVTSSQAQTVYSQNIVGYVNTTLSSAGAGFTLVTAPLQGTNTAVDILMPCLQTFDSVLIWNGNGYYTYQYVGNGANTPGGTGPGNWSNTDPGNASNPPNITPGEGFFYQNSSGGNETNTFTGQCVLSNNVVLASAGAGFSLAASSAPIAGNADDTNSINLPLQTFDSVLVWNGNGYYTYQYVGNGYNTPGGQGPGNWSNTDPGNAANPPVLTVGQGFFYQNSSGAPETWSQNIVVQP